jgi:PKD repeat protein
MNKLAIKYLFAFVVFTAFAVSQVFAQTITIGNVDPGPYGNGSKVAIPFNINDAGGCIAQTNTYSLFMSDATGNFVSATPVATINSFYATFFNYTIPAALPAGSGYKFMIKASSPVISTAASNAITVNATAGVAPSALSTSISAANPEVYGQCTGAANTTFSFLNTTAGATTVTASFFNEITQSYDASNVNILAGYNFTAALANYTVTVKAVNAAGTIGTYAYQLINNQVSTTIGFTGNPTVCLVAGSAPLTYNIDYTSANGIQNNYPGNLYTLSWGDGSASTVLTLCQIRALLGQVTHSYSKPSCGNVVNGQNNSFAVNFRASNTFCGNIGSVQTSYAKIVISPTNFIKAPKAACTNTLVDFFNGSIPGPDPNSASNTCQDNPNALYTWIVDGVVVKTSYKLAQDFLYTFNTTGIHMVTVHAQTSNGACIATDYTDTICIQNAPQPVFTLPVKTICISGGPVTITPTNTSVIDSACNTNNQFIWFVKGPAAVTYAGGTTVNSKIPQFVFSAPGLYTVQLGINSCSLVKTAIDTIIVNAAPVATLSPDFATCGIGQTFNFNGTKLNDPTYTILTGTALGSPSTYKWVVVPPTGGLPAILNDTSKYPKITFQSAGIYTVTVTQTNNCGTVTSAPQNINFLLSPTVLAGKDTSICSGGTANLNGTITGGGVTSLQWTGGTGTFTPGRNSLQTAYTPSAAEVAAGKVPLILLVTTSIGAPCDTIRSIVNVNIVSLDTVTSANSITACSAQPLNYKITASIPSSFTWTAALTSGNATGFKNGSGTTINDIITNSSQTAPAVVTYTIVPVGACTGAPFQLTVTLSVQTISFTTAPKSGCGNLPVQFTNTSGNLAGSFSWNFGDGGTSAAVNPTHTFVQRFDGKDTTYYIKLTGIGTCGQNTSVTDSVLVRPAVPIAKILPAQTTACGTFALNVINDSPGNNVQYDYYLYDGLVLVQHITKTDKNPIVFNPVSPAKVKTYTLYMIATGYCNNTAQTINIPITVSPNTIVAQTFEKNNIYKGCAPLALTFINNSSGGSSFNYNIYDVNHKLIAQPLADTTPFLYTFNKTGVYYVTLTAANSCGSTESSPPLRIDVFAIPKVDFVADITNGCKKINVNFTNLTTDSLVQASSLTYDWDFGDGSAHSSAYMPPTHTYYYSANSPYTVTLTVINAGTGCTAVNTKKSYIVVTSPPGTNFLTLPDSVVSIPDYHFSFVDKTSGSPVSWLWTFSNGKTSTLKNPEITFPDTGLYKVTLTTANAAGCDSTLVRNVRITGVPGQIYLPNAFIPTSLTPDLKVFMPKGSGLSTWHLQIFNNYGQLIWETSKLNSKGAPIEGWDGTYKGQPAPQGVYVWQASATFINGTEWKGMSYNNSLPRRVGSVHLIR